MRCMFFSILAFFNLSIWASDLSLVVDRDDVLAWTQNGSDIDPRSLLALSDGSLVYFEDDGGLGDAGDALIRIRPNGTPQFEVLAEEYNASDSGKDLLITPGGGTCCAYGSDLALGPDDTIYALISDTSQSSASATNYVVRLLSDGNGGYGDPAVVTGVWTGGYEDGQTFHRLTVSGGALYILFDSRDPANNGEGGGNPANGIYRFDLGQSDTTGTGGLTLVTSFEDMVLAVNAEATGDEGLELAQIRSGIDGDLYGFLFHRNPSTGALSAGTLVRIDPDTGSAEDFLNAADMQPETGWDQVFDDFTNLAINPSTGHFYALETGTGGTRENLYHLDASGHYLGQEAHNRRFVDLPGADIDESMYTSGTNTLAADGNGKLWIWFTGAGKESLAEIDTAADCTPSFQWPVAGHDGSVGHPFGPRIIDNDGGRYDFHRGIDLPLPLGTEIVAATDGVVESVTQDTTSCTVNGQPVTNVEYTVVVRNDGCSPALYTRYQHLSAVDSAWQSGTEPSISAGQRIGESGQSCKGFRHLHFEVRNGGSYQSHATNPLYYLGYQDQPPSEPVLDGHNHDANGRLFAFTITTDQYEMDMDGFELKWGTDTLAFPWQWTTRAAGPQHPEYLDRPVVDHGNGMLSVTFPEDRNATDASASWRTVVAGLGPAGGGGYCRATDLTRRSPWIVLPATAPTLNFTPGLETTAVTLDRDGAGNPLDTEVLLTATLTNSGGAAVTVQDLRGTSAANLDFDLALPTGVGLPFSLNPSQSVQVQITLIAEDIDGRGEAFLLEAELGSGQVWPLALKVLDIQ